MTRDEIQENVGNAVFLNGDGDLAMSAWARGVIGSQVKIVKLTDGGRTIIELADGSQESVSPGNLDFVDPPQPPLTLTHKSFTRGEIEGKPCVVIYDESTDKTTVIVPQSKWYAQAMAAMDILEVASTPLPTSPKKTILHRRPSKLILPGTNASN